MDEITALDKELERLRLEPPGSEHSDAKITHGICPECMIKFYGKDFPPE